MRLRVVYKSRVAGRGGRGGDVLLVLTIEATIVRLHLGKSNASFSSEINVGSIASYGYSTHYQLLASELKL